MPFDFSFSSLMAGLIFSVIGWWLFREGKRRSHLTLVIIGLILMSYTLFTRTALATWGIGLSLCALAYHLWND